jgi:hypothetical protein
VALGALVTFAVFGGTGLAGSTAKPTKAQYAPGQYQNANKVTLCHKAKVTIRVSVNALPAHEAHGDVVGTCGAAAAKAKAKAKAEEAATTADAATATGGQAKGNGASQAKGGNGNGNGKGNGKS